ncbi:AAA family ATPase [Rathayibacter sp. VKM Ac-2835]|nr:AAA family ATPase [Rathayibacter sp. VKM Ac-2835]
MSDYSITICDCNSIDKAVIALRRGALNIKYGPNGIGKSTIARALTLRAEDSDQLSEKLTPFKYKDKKNAPRPSVQGAEDIAKVMTFNDDYVSTFVFRPDEVVENSFEIFINTEEYRAGVEEIAARFDSLKQTFTDEPEFDAALSSFEELRDAFNVTKGGALAKTSKAFKGIGVGGKMSQIPESLQGYKSFIESDDPATWIKWQATGKTYLGLSDNCPFCSTSDVDKTVAAQLSDEYDSAAVRNLSNLRAVIDRVGQYIAPDDLQKLRELTKSISGLTSEQESFVVSLRGAVVTLLTKLAAAKSLSFQALKDENNIAPLLNDLKIDLNYLSVLDSEATQSVVQLINEKLSAAISEINEINAQIGKQNSRVKKLIRENQGAINSFLTSAGYRYAVRIAPSDGTYRMLLEHVDFSGHIKAAHEHLSYGERNAFALVLFMHDVQHRKPDLVVLDDPVSSFDKTKKFAILHQLFRGENSLRGTTTLLLTHDIEPAIDMVRTSTAKKFQAAKPAVHFLSGKKGIVTERPVAPTDIATFTEVCEANISSVEDTIIRCIYLRRLSEVHGLKGVDYELLSSLLHAREIPSRIIALDEFEPLTAAEVRAATDRIRKYISDFEYSTVLGEMKETGSLRNRFDATSVGYEKVQLFRIMLALDPEMMKGDEVFAKFVNETYHIENEYVMQLNPRDFDAVPEFVIAACSDLVEKAATA